MLRLHCLCMAARAMYNRDSGEAQLWSRAELGEARCGRSAPTSERHLFDCLLEEEKERLVTSVPEA